MLTILFEKNTYNFWKSGMLLDFFFKKIIANFLFFFFYIFNLLFSEKYFVEQNFLKLSIYLNFLKNFSNIISKNIIYYSIGFIWVLNAIIIIILIND